MRTAKRRFNRDGGYILVSVLAVLLVLTGSMTAASIMLRSTINTARVYADEVRLAGLSRSGLELAAYQLLVIKADPAAVDGRSIKIGGGVVTPHVEDEAGKVDLNGSDLRLLDSVFKHADVDEGTAARLLSDIRNMRGHDLDDGANQPAASSPTSEASADRPRRRGFQSVDQLISANGLSRSEKHLIKGSLTVYNPDGKINIVHANRQVLAAIPGLSNADVEIVLRSRESADHQALQALLLSDQDAKPYIKTSSGPAYTVAIDAYLHQSKRSTGAVIGASKASRIPFYIFEYWR